MNEPIFLNPVFHEKIWGGDKLHTIFGYTIPSVKTGECWAISAHPNGVCTVNGGEYADRLLSDLWKESPELFGNPEEDVFPLLTKILDAEDNLSVQVHPNDEYGKTHAGELGKTECWYVIDADEDSEIVYGHNAKTREELKEMIDHGEWDKLLRRVKVKAGDFFYVPSGTIHAIGKGIMILETQQSSDTTYRVYDYDRIGDDGKKRELHIQESIDVTNVPSYTPTLDFKKETIQNSVITSLVENDFFSVFEWQIDGEVSFQKESPYTLVSVIDGKGEISLANGNSYPLKKGIHFILPSGVNQWKITGKIKIIASNPGK